MAQLYRPMESHLVAVWSTEQSKVACMEVGEASTTIAVPPRQRVGAGPWSPSRRAVTYLMAVNALNLLDAFLTGVAIRSGLAVEGNPVVSAIGLDGKLILVAAASLALAILRPRALLIPIIALGAVCLWSAANLTAL